ncbi:MAG: hypothetical protein KJO86_05260, partial [Muriicola sp.]|nr:hypothetical protein [Muriicola sp.]
MKKLLFAMMGFCVLAVQAQSDANDLFAAGVEDAETFMNDYLAPVSEGAIYSIAGSWFNTGDAKPLGGFEVSIIGNITGFKNKEDKKTFILNTADYQNLQFVDGSTTKTVSSALGDIEGVRVFVEAEVAPGVTSREEFDLPSGLAAEDINFIPSGFIQGSVGLIKGTEIKARFLPKIDTDDVAISLIGVGIQHEFTKHLPADKILPVAISGVIGYTNIKGTYDFTDTSIIAGSDQRIDAKINTWVFQAVVSTKLPVINFYGSLGYLSGKSETAILGTYDVQSGPFQESYTDPFTLNKDASGVTANVGTKIKLGFFRLHA